MTIAQRIIEPERSRVPNLAVLVKRREGVPMEEALMRADEAGAVIASNRSLSMALVGSEGWKAISEAFICWTGTMTAYDKPDQKLGKNIKYTDSKGMNYIFPVPEQHQGKTNVILVAEHPDFTIETEGSYRIIRAAKVDIVERFPAGDDWFICDPKYGIPYGNKMADGSNHDARYLWRIDKRVDKRVGLVARARGDYDCGQLIILNYGPAARLGVAVEAPSDAKREV